MSNRVTGSAHIRSERASLAVILTMVNAIRRHLRANYLRTGAAAIETALGTIHEEASGLMEQVRQGVHANPLLIYGNPQGDRHTAGFHEAPISVGMKLGEVEQLTYDRTTRPRGYYFHDFGEGDALHIAQTRQGSRIVVIANEDLRPLWGTTKEE